MCFYPQSEDLGAWYPYRSVEWQYNQVGVSRESSRGESLLLLTTVMICDDGTMICDDGTINRYENNLIRLESVVCQAEEKGAFRQRNSVKKALLAR